MMTVALRDQLADQLKSSAARRQISIEQLVNDWLAEQLWREQNQKIQAEAERFRAKHLELLAQYAGQYIAMRDGIVLDHDAELLALHARIRARYGDEPILMAPVTADPIETHHVLGTRQRKGQP
jgi:hypothetical protein